MNCSAPFPGPRGDRDPWPDNGKAKLPERPPQLRAVLLMAAAAFVVLLALSVGSAYLQLWWRSS